MKKVYQIFSLTTIESANYKSIQNPLCFSNEADAIKYMNELELWFSRDGKTYECPGSDFVKRETNLFSLPKGLVLGQSLGYTEEGREIKMYVWYTEQVVCESYDEMGIDVGHDCILAERTANPRTL